MKHTTAPTDNEGGRANFAVPLTLSKVTVCEFEIFEENQNFDKETLVVSLKSIRGMVDLFCIPLSLMQTLLRRNLCFVY